MPRYRLETDDELAARGWQVGMPIADVEVDEADFATKTVALDTDPRFKVLTEKESLRRARAREEQERRERAEREAELTERAEQAVVDRRDRKARVDELLEWLYPEGS